MDNGNEYRVLTAHPEPAPDEFGLIFADFLQNLRSSLDYLVGAMRADGPSRNSRFPILLERPKGPHGFRRRACVSLQGIPDEAVELIHFMQPYHRPDVPIRHAFKTLAAVEALWNIAKHRTLYVVTAATKPDYVGRERSDDQAKSIGWRFPGPDHSSDIWLPITEPQEDSIHISRSTYRSHNQGGSQTTGRDGLKLGNSMGWWSTSTVWSATR